MKPSSAPARPRRVRSRELVALLAEDAAAVDLRERVAAGGGCAPRGSSHPSRPAGSPVGPAVRSANGWGAVLASRRPERHGAREFLVALGVNALVLHGTQDAADSEPEWPTRRNQAFAVN